MARGSVARALAWRSALGLAAAVLMMGCPPRGATGVGDAPDAPSGELGKDRAASLEAERSAARAAFAPLVEAHNARVALLESFDVPAATILRYPNGDRVQEDQLDGFIYLASRGRGAFELRLLGKTWAWLGGDGTKSWIYFSPPNEPTRLHVYDRLVDGARADSSSVVGTAELTLLTPGSLRFLLGLSPIAAEWTVAPIARDPASQDAAAAELAAGLPLTERYEVRWSPTTATVASARFGAEGLPTQLAVTDLAGNSIARTALAAYARVLRPNLAIGAWPMTATKVTIDAPRSKASARLMLDKDALTRIPRRAREEFFDLSELQLYLAPTEVVYHDPSGAIRDPEPVGAMPRGPAPTPPAKVER